MTIIHKERCRVYFEVDMLADILKEVYKITDNHMAMNLVVGPCDEKYSPTLWFAHFDATDKEIEQIKNKFEGKVVNLL